MIAVLTTADILLFAFVLIAVFAALAFFSWFSWRISQKTIDPSPYTGVPLRRASDIGFYQAEKVYQYLTQKSSYDNPLFDLQKASFCRDTGRIFPHSINWLDCIRVDWNFLQKRHRGHYVSWGSLSQQQQTELRRIHGSLEDYQTQMSSTQPIPRLVEPVFAFTKPGPLYVDVTTNTLLGWQIVPETDFEVLIVQHPLKIIEQKPT